MKQGVVATDYALASTISLAGTYPMPRPLFSMADPHPF
jgi:hypothetical protein